MGARPSTPRRRAAARWVGLGLALFALQAIWALSIPLMASPDEPPTWSAPPRWLTASGPERSGPPRLAHHEP